MNNINQRFMLLVEINFLQMQADEVQEKIKQKTAELTKLEDESIKR